MNIIKGNLNTSTSQTKEFNKIIRAIQNGDTSIYAIGIKTNEWIKPFSDPLNSTCGCSFDILVLLQPVSKNIKLSLYPCVLGNKRGLIIDYSDEIKTN
jgi:hypothetical protein